MEVHFYLPEKYLPDSARQEAWKQGNITGLEPGGKAASAQAWIYQTWLALEKSGFPARLTHEIPADGVMVSLTGFFGDKHQFPPDLFFVGIVADYLPHPAAGLHVVQNSTHSRRLGNSVFIPHWPQPNLMPRDPARGDIFENVCFYGDASNLAPELREENWKRKLKQDLGIEFTICDADRWHDYRETDCVVALRVFGNASYLHKPATKLYNAWLAGTPFIAGGESSYSGDGVVGANFLQAASPNELFSHLERLKKNPSLRMELATSGRLAAKAFDAAATTERWKMLVGETIPPLAERWKTMSRGKRRAFRVWQKASVWLDRRLRR